MHAPWVLPKFGFRRSTAHHHHKVFPRRISDAFPADIGIAEPVKKSRFLLRKPPICALAEGELVADAKDVVKICQIWDVMLGTSHLSKQEVLHLARFAHQEKFDKLVITHANWAVMCDYSASEMQRLIELGAWIEFCAAAILPPAPARNIPEEVALLKRIGSQRCILASDAGAQVNGTAPSVFRSYLQMLNNAGLPGRKSTGWPLRTRDYFSTWIVSRALIEKRDMKDSIEYPLFSRSEMDRRYVRAKELMAQRGIDVLLSRGRRTSTTSPAAARVSRSTTRSPDRASWSCRSRASRSLSRRISMLITLATYVSDFRSYFDVLGFPHQLIVETLQGGGAAAPPGRRGARAGAAPGDPGRRVPGARRRDAEHEFVDAADMFVKLRMVKSAEEVVYMKQAADVTARARQRLFDRHVHAGYDGTRRRSDDAAADARGGRRPHRVRSSAARSARVHQPVPLRSAAPEGGHPRGGYGRVRRHVHDRLSADATLGTATAAQKGAYRRGCDVTRRMTAALKPGVGCSDLHRVAVAAIDAARRDRRPPGTMKGGARFGHGQGMLLTEPPSINPGDDTLLEAGMVFSTEPSIRMGAEHCRSRISTSSPRTATSRSRSRPTSYERSSGSTPLISAAQRPPWWNSPCKPTTRWTNTIRNAVSTITMEQRATNQGSTG